MTMKKTLAFLLALTLLLGLCACGSTGTSSTPATAQSEAPAVSEAPEVTEEPAATQEPEVTEAPAATEEPVEVTPDPASDTSELGGFHTSVFSREVEDEDPLIAEVYDANELENVLALHDCMTVTITCYNGDNTLYTKVVEASRLDDGSIQIRVHYESDLGTCEAIGNSQAGYMAAKWDDGTTEVTCSMPEEFLNLAEETYIDPEYLVTYTNVKEGNQDGARIIDCDMSYTGNDTVYETMFYLDPEDNHLLAISSDFYSDQGGCYTLCSFSYDTPYNFVPCSALDDAMNARDAVDLTVNYLAPEYDFQETCVYHMSQSLTPYVETMGHCRLYTDTNLGDQITNIVLNGDTTIYALVTDYTPGTANYTE